MLIEDWLELAEAAQILGVHQSTLRRWADAGKIPHIRTLSGRRRFSRTALEQSRQEMNRMTAPYSRSAAERPQEQFETKTLDLARQRTSDFSNRQASWFDQLDEEHRLLFRYSGQRLLSLVMQFIRHGEPVESLLENALKEGRKISQDYGRICYRAGLTVAQTAEAFLYFRRSILESVQGSFRSGGVNAADNQQIFLRTIDFFDALLVTTMDSYANTKQLEGGVAFQGEQIGESHVINQA